MSTTPIKTPRTDEAERRCHDEEGTHDLVLRSDMEVLEIENGVLKKERDELKAQLEVLRQGKERLVTCIKAHEVGVMNIVRKHNELDEQNQYSCGHYVGMGKAYRNVLAMLDAAMKEVH